MKATIKQQKLKIRVEWNSFGEEKDDKKAQDLYRLSIEEYISRFNALPPLGLFIGNGYCDPGKIIQVNFDGCNDEVFIYLEF